MSSDVPELLAPLLLRLQHELRREARAIVAEIIQVELRRREIVIDTVSQALDAAMAKVTAPAPAASTPPSPPSAQQPTRSMQPPSTEQRTIGTVKWFNDAKGFGFLVGEDGRDVFVHYKHITGSGFRSLPEGMRVTYLARAGERGPFALDVRPEVASDGMQ